MIYGKSIDYIIVDDMYKKVESYYYRFYNGPDPVRRCRYTQDWLEVKRWMQANGVDYCLLNMNGVLEYVFVVESRQDWFMLRWT